MIRIELWKVAGNILMNKKKRCIKSVGGSVYFGDYVKVIEIITAHIPPVNINQITQVNLHGLIFQPSTGIVDIQGLQSSIQNISQGA